MPTNRENVLGDLFTYLQRQTKPKTVTEIAEVLHMPYSSVAAYISKWVQAEIVIIATGRAGFGFEKKYVLNEGIKNPSEYVYKRSTVSNTDMVIRFGSSPNNHLTLGKLVNPSMALSWPAPRITWECMNWMLVLRKIVEVWYIVRTNEKIPEHLSQDLITSREQLEDLYTRAATLANLCQDMLNIYPLWQVGHLNAISEWDEETADEFINAVDTWFNAHPEYLRRSES